MKKRPTVIISGGCGGVGQAAGRLLAESGCDIIALYFSTPPETAQTIIKSFPLGDHEAIRCDIRDAKTTTTMIEQIAQSRGAIDACVHTAVDPITRKNMLELTEAEFHSQMGTAVFGGFNLLTAAAKKMKHAGNGAIIGILSKYVEADIPHSRLSAYVTAKYALRGILKELSLELAPHHISVNAIAPGFLDTKLNADLPEAVRAFVQDKMSAGSIRTPEEAARVLAFLLSDAGKPISGKIYSFVAEETSNL